MNSFINVLDLDLYIISLMSFKELVIIKTLNKYYNDLIKKYCGTNHTTLEQIKMYNTKLNIEFYKCPLNLINYNLSYDYLKNIEYHKIQYLICKFLIRKKYEKIIIFYRFNDTLKKLMQETNFNFLNFNNYEEIMRLLSKFNEEKINILFWNIQFLYDFLFKSKKKNIKIYIMSTDIDSYERIFNNVRSKKKIDFNLILLDNERDILTERIYNKIEKGKS